MHVAVGDRLLAPGQFLGLGLGGGLARSQPLLELGHLGSSVGDLALAFGALGEEFLACGDASLLHLGLGFAAGILEDSIGLALGIGQPAGTHASVGKVAHDDPRGQRKEDEKSVHRVSFELCAPMWAGWKSEKRV